MVTCLAGWVVLTDTVYISIDGYIGTYTDRGRLRVYNVQLARLNCIEHVWYHGINSFEASAGKDWN